MTKKELAAERSRRWRANNREHHRTYSQQWVKDNPERAREMNRAWKEKNRTRVNSQSKAWLAQKREQIRTLARKAKGYPQPEWPCPDLCECCGRPPGLRALALDHCHETDVFRGWLCHRCNLGLGLLGDTDEGIQKVVDYLSKARRALKKAK